MGYSDPILWHEVVLYRYTTKSQLTLELPHGMTGLELEEFVCEDYPDWEIVNYN